MLEATTVTAEEIEQFVMPDVTSGMPVRWFPFGIRDGRELEIGFIVRSSGRNVHLRTAGGGFKSAVRHVDDPKLRLNASQREAGAWDFTESWYTEQQEKAQLLGQLRDLLDRVGRLEVQIHRDQQDVQQEIEPAKVKSKHEPYFAKLKRLRSEAEKAGVDIQGLTVKKLEAALAIALDGKQ